MAPASRASALEARVVTCVSGGQAVVRRVSLAVERGELLALCGWAGSGTSVLLRALAGLVVPDGGRVLVDGVPSRGLGAPRDPRRFATGAARSALLTTAPRDGVVLLDGADDDAATADRMLGRGRELAERGAAVVVTSNHLDAVARHAHTAALLEAGRLLAWAAPAVAFVPALALLGRRRDGASTTRRRALALVR